MFGSAWTLLLQETARQTAWQRMDPDTRGRVFVMLGTLIILGVVMIGLAWLTARLTRHYANRRFGPSEPSNAFHDPDDWAKKPLIEAIGDDANHPPADEHD